MHISLVRTYIQKVRLSDRKENRFKLISEWLMWQKGWLCPISQKLNAPNDQDVWRINTHCLTKATLGALQKLFHTGQIVLFPLIRSLVVVGPFLGFCCCCCSAPRSTQSVSEDDPFLVVLDIFPCFRSRQIRTRNRKPLGKKIPFLRSLCRIQTPISYFWRGEKEKEKIVVCILSSRYKRFPLYFWLHYSIVVRWQITRLGDWAERSDQSGERGGREKEMREKRIEDLQKRFLIFLIEHLKIFLVGFFPMYKKDNSVMLSAFKPKHEFF